MKDKKNQDVEHFLEDFFRLSKLGKNFTLQDLKKTRDEAYMERNIRHFKKSKKLYSLESLYQKR